MMRLYPVLLRRGVLIVAASFALVACAGSAPPVPRDNYYRLLVQMPERMASQPLLGGTVAVAPLDADGLLRERPVLFTAEDDAHVLLQHDYHYWSETPARLIQFQLVEYLRRAGVADLVVTPDLRVAADYEVAGRLIRLERLASDRHPKVAVSLELSLVDRRHDKVMAMDVYSEEMVSADHSVQASVDAMNAALAKVFGRFRDELRAAELSRAGGGKRISQAKADH